MSVAMVNNYVAQKLRPPISYYGGKVYICRHILQMAPADYRVYVEPFCGGCAVLLNKYRSEVEVISDVNPELINFYHVLVDTPELVIERVQQIPFGRATFEAAKAAENRGDELSRAVNFLVRQHMSYSGIGKTWAEDKGRNWVTHRDEARKFNRKGRTWERLPYDLDLAAKRLQGVRIILGNALSVIPEYDSSETWYYLDPPYSSPTRVSPKMYAHEMSELDHLRLLRLIRSLKGKVILSGYANPMYDKELVGWDRVEVDFVTFSSPQKGSKAERTEVLWVKS
jgi:DNA adenine methylase